MVVGRVFTPTRVVLYIFILFVCLISYFVSHAPRPDPHRGVINFAPSGYNWADYAFKHSISEQDMTKLPQGNPVTLRSIQHDFSRNPLKKRNLNKSQRERKAEIKRAFGKTWASYEKHAWGRDELKPLTLEGHDPLGGWAASMIDSLDTLWLMDMKSEFYRAVGYLAQLDWDKTTSEGVNVSETNVRHLGGLLSAYELSREGVLLAKAIELGDLLYASFDNPQHLPPNEFTFKDLKDGNVRPEAHQSTAGLGSMTLEFTRLSQLTMKPKYYDAVSRITREFDRTQNETALPGVWPEVVDAQNNFEVSHKVFSVGSDGEALYEYLLKEHMLLQGLDPAYEKMYLQAAEEVRHRMIFRPMLPGKEDILMMGKVEVNSRKRLNFYPHLEHHSCFAGGMFAMGGKVFGKKDHIEIGEKLTRGCAHAYSVFPSGLMPEVSSLQPCPDLQPCDFNPTFSTTIPLGFQPKDKHYFLRPEAIESIFILYRVTGKQEFRDIAWDMWLAIQNATETDDAFATVEDVTKAKSQKSDSMKSFWLAETLKYFWLTFEDENILSLDKWVFNTEGHPFKRPAPKVHHLWDW
ncbi:Fc.00g021780.m01.CDS01 [Cosmosporella sp. VM-42]